METTMYTPQKTAEDLSTTRFQNPVSQPIDNIAKAKQELIQNIFESTTCTGLVGSFISGLGFIVSIGSAGLAWSLGESLGVLATATFVTGGITGLALVVCLVAWATLNLVDNINKPLAEHGQGWSRLHMAAARGQVMRTKLLLFLGANPNVLSHDQDTPLHLAARFEAISPKSHSKVMKILVDAGAKVNIPRGEEGQDQGLTPLYDAVRARNVAQVKCLIENGAFVNLYGNDAMTPLELATSRVSKGNALKIDQDIHKILHRGPYYQPCADEGYMTCFIEKMPAS